MGSETKNNTNTLPETKFRIANNILIITISLIIIIRILGLVNLIMAYPSHESTNLKVIATLAIIISVVMICLFSWLIREMLKFKKSAYGLLILLAICSLLFGSHVKVTALGVILPLVSLILAFFIMIGLSPQNERRVFLVKAVIGL